VHAPSDVADVAQAAAEGAKPAAFDFETVFLSDYARIARVIRRVIDDPSRAEDLAVEAFWKLWRNPGAHGEASGGWLYRTAVRLALDELRRKARRTRYERALTFGRAPGTPDELFSATEERGRVHAVLAAMAPRQAELLLLRSDGAEYDELASALSLNPASVGTFLSRARLAFRKEYVKRYGEQ
jgi:RNA polymerase sigma factor (sigma-70 family)